MSQNIRQIRYEISKDYTTIKHFLRERRYPRAVLMQLKNSESQVLLNTLPAPLWKPLHGGDRLEISIREQKESSLQLVPVAANLDIVYEDEDVLVVNKPGGMSIHPSFNHYEDSLANAVLGYYGRKGPESSTSEDGGGSFVFRCINRLDKETSGLTIVAKNMLSAAILGVDVKNRQIHREYRAIVEGALPDDKMWHKIDAPIGRMPGSALMRQVDFRHGKPAVTWYQVLETSEKYSLLKLRLESGRTHQIRVHMKYIGHPLPGDYLYNPVFQDIKRVPLHSSRLEFTQPVTGEKIVLECPVPEELCLIF